MTVPLTVVIDGRRHKAQDWSFGGFRVVDFGDRMWEGEELPGQLVLPYRDSTLHIDIRFRVVWRAKIDVGCQFLELPRTARLALQHLLQDAMEGKLPDIESALRTAEDQEPGSTFVEQVEEAGETPIEADPPQGQVKTVKPYLAAAAVVLIAALLLLARNPAFTENRSAGSSLALETTASRLDVASTTSPAPAPSTTSPAIEPAEELPPRMTQSPEPSAADSPVATLPPAPDLDSGGTAVQLGAFGSEDGAWRFADKVASKSPQLPAGADYHLRPMNRREPDGLIRLLVGPLATAASGKTLCTQFRESGYDCIVRSAGWLEAQP